MMKKSLTAMIFLLLALALCLVPSVGMLVHGPAEARANESAARAPELTGRDGALTRTTSPSSRTTPARAFTCAGS